MNKILKVLLVGAMAAAVGPIGKDAMAGEWTTIFNGKDVKGWEKKGGKASYKVEDGCIVGTTKPTRPTHSCVHPRSMATLN